MIEIAKKANVELRLDTIEAYHRLKRENGIQPVIVRFTNRRSCEQLLKQKKQLKDAPLSEINGLDINTKIYLSENLCPYYQKLF